MAQICKKCLLREMAEADAKMIEKYKEAIKKEDQVSESEYERRLTVCKTCELLNAELASLLFLISKKRVLRIYINLREPS